MLDSQIFPSAPGVGGGDPLCVQHLRHTAGRYRLQQLENATDQIEFLVGAGQPDDMVALLPHDLAVCEPTHRGAIIANQVPPESKWRPPTRGESFRSQLQLGVQHFLRQFVPELAACFVVDAGGNDFADVLTLAPSERNQRRVHEDQRDAQPTQFLFEDDPIDGMIRPGESIASWNEDVGHIAVTEDLAIERVERRAFQLIAADAVVEKQIPVVGLT